MKIREEKIKKRKQFEPFDLVITVENIDELKSLWHRFNASVAFGRFDDDDHYRSNLYNDFNDDNIFGTYDVWELIDDKLEKSC